MKSPGTRSATIVGVRIATVRTRLPAVESLKLSLLPALRAVSFCLPRILREVCPTETQAVTAFRGQDGFQLSSRSSA